MTWRAWPSPWAVWDCGAPSERRRSFSVEAGSTSDARRDIPKLRAKSLTLWRRMRKVSTFQLVSTAEIVFCISTLLHRSGTTWHADIGSPQPMGAGSPSDGKTTDSSREVSDLVLLTLKDPRPKTREAVGWVAFQFSPSFLCHPLESKLLRVLSFHALSPTSLTSSTLALPMRPSCWLSRPSSFGLFVGEGVWTLRWFSLKSVAARVCREVRACVLSPPLPKVDHRRLEVGTNDFPFCTAHKLQWIWMVTPVRADGIDHR